VAEYDSVIPAGGSGTLNAEIRTAPLQTRRLSKSISITTDSTETPNLVLRFTVEGRTPIIVKPHARFYVRSVEGEEARSRVLLRGADGEKLEVLGAQTDFDFLDVVIEPVEKKEVRDGIEGIPGDVWLDLVLSPDAPIGTRRGQLLLTTNLPAARSFSVGYVTRVQPLIVFSPDGVRLWVNVSREGDGASTFISLKYNKQESFNVTGVSVTHPEIFTATSVRERASPRQTVRVELAEGLKAEDLKGVVRGWVEITTDADPESKIEIPVLVAPNRGGTKRKFHQRRSIVSGAD
jgi:hypothetical protein